MIGRMKYSKERRKIKKRPAPRFLMINQRIFDKLYKKWREETQFDSFIGDPHHKSYEIFLKYGYKVVPYIITKLKEEPSLIFVALIRITIENPIKHENRGNIKKMAEDWIEWWEKKNNTMKS
jgi:hypothetical protein